MHLWEFRYSKTSVGTVLAITSFSLFFKICDYVLGMYNSWEMFFPDIVDKICNEKLSVEEKITLVKKQSKVGVFGSVFSSPELCLWWAIMITFCPSSIHASVR